MASRSRVASATSLEDLMAQAALGDAEACFELGLMHAVGRGVALDYVAAHKWFNLAAMAGESRAAAERSALAEEMSPAEVAEAQRQARAWRSRPGMQAAA